MYGVSMMFSYWLMLLVMTYNVGLFITVVAGLVLGRFAFSKLMPVPASGAINGKSLLIDSNGSAQH